MLDKNGFNRWSEDYDADVKDSDQNHKYPFDGYDAVLERIYHKIDCGRLPQVLDIGFGTGVLLQRLYQKGCRVSGVDFSEKMAAVARRKMPGGSFVVADFSHWLPEGLKGKKFDFILSTYAFHHLMDMQKAEFLTELAKNSLRPGGKILIGDVAFQTGADLRLCRERFAAIWDTDEIYMTADRMLPLLQKAGLDCSYGQVSSCAGILEITKK